MSENIRPHSLKAWTIFVRPKTLIISIAPVMSALALVAAEHHRINWGIALLTISLAMLLQVISNMENDLGYTIRKAEKTNRKGWARATTVGLISINAARRSIVFLALMTLLNTLALISIGGWVFAIIGIASLLAAYCYMGGPKPIAYTPLGEITVLIFFGVTAVCGTYFLQTQQISSSAIVLSFAIGCLATTVLALNNWRDREHDKSVERHTLAVVLSKEHYLYFFKLLLILPYVCIVALSVHTPAFLLVFLSVFLVPKILKGLQTRVNEELNLVFLQCLQLEVFFCLLFTAGAVVTRVV